MDNNNNIILQKMINVSSDHSEHNDPENNKNMIKMRNSFLMTKYHERKRFLSEIGKENKVIFSSYFIKLFRCSAKNCQDIHRMINCPNAEIGEENGVRRLKYIAKILLAVIFDCNKHRVS